jgi:hypothetical protein
MKQAHELTRFPLRGAHAALSCSACHTRSSSGQLQFVGRSIACQSCHAADARAVTVPDHKSAGFTECTACHSISSWKNARFDHSQTAFPLAGAHQAVTCDGCHADQVFKGKDTQCVSCHRVDYDQAAAPRHADGFPTTCADCHSNTAWKGATFDHGTTRFALTGAHNAVACTGCHADQVYRGKSTECLSCHQSDFQGTTNPNHAAAGFTAPCTVCHTTTAWAGSFNHDASDFPLTGTHRTTTCSGCHADNVYNGKPTPCVSCHQADYGAAKTPPHSGFPTACESCHSTGTWTGATFNHATTDFPLTGAHQATSCAGCHGDGVFNGKATDCVSCHRPRYDATTSPAHAAAGYSTTCAPCLHTTAWLGAVFNHATTLSTHRCSPHHHLRRLSRRWRLSGKSMECLSCHQADYTRPPVRRTAVPALAPRAPHATPRRPGLAERTITTSRVSRSPEHIAPRVALAVTPTACTTESPPSA